MSQPAAEPTRTAATPAPQARTVVVAASVSTLAMTGVGCVVVAIASI